MVVNNAGYTWDGVAHKMTDEQFQAMLDIHTVVPFRMVRGVAPHMREAAKAETRRGPGGLPQDRQRHVDLGHDGQRGAGQLLLGQGGVTGLTKTLAKEWGQFKINCNAVAFGFVETRLTQAKEKGETIEAPAMGERSRSASPSRCGTWPR